MYSDLLGSMLRVRTWIMWWKRRDLASVYSAFHSGQFLSAHRTHSQISSEKIITNCVVFAIIDFHLFLFLVPQFYASLSMMWCFVYLKQSSLLPKTEFPFYVHWRLLSGPVSLMVAAVTLLALLFENWNYNRKVWGNLLCEWCFLQDRVGMMSVTDIWKHLARLKTTE